MPVPFPLPCVRPPIPAGAAFDDVTHTYTQGGRVLVSVTQVLNEAGFVDFSEVPRHRLAEAQARGTAVHQAVHYWLENDLDPDSLEDPEHRAYLASAQAYMAESGLRPICDERGQSIGVEYRWWHPSRGDAGTIDLIAYDPQGPAFVVVDWKTGEPDDVAAHIQLAAYQDATRRLLDTILPPKSKLRRLPLLRRSVKLWRDGRTGRVSPYDGPDHVQDFGIYLAALTCATYRRNGLRTHTPASRELERLAAGFV